MLLKNLLIFSLLKIPCLKSENNTASDLIFFKLFIKNSRVVCEIDLLSTSSTFNNL